jgi:uroporphyrinogen decarboxylase
MSEKIFRELFKPRMEEYIRFIKKMAKNAKIQFHSCGSIISIIGDLIDVGVDVLNPVQVSARDMNPIELKKKFGQEMCFLGAIDTQEVLPHGKAKEVIDEVKRIIGILAPGGGYILSSVHNIQPEVPPENIVAMFEAASEYGKYPIKGL